LVEYKRRLDAGRLPYARRRPHRYDLAMENDTLTDTSTEADAAAAAGDDDAELIEEISIDGMCGVY